MLWNMIVEMFANGASDQEVASMFLRALFGMDYPSGSKFLFENPNPDSHQVAYQIWANTSLLSTVDTGPPAVLISAIILLLVLAKVKNLIVVASAESHQRVYKGWKPILAIVSALFAYQIWLALIAIGEGFAIQLASEQAIAGMIHDINAMAKALASPAGGGYGSADASTLNTASQAGGPSAGDMTGSALSLLIMEFGLFVLRLMFRLRAMLLHVYGFIFPLLLVGAFTGVPAVSKKCRSALMSFIAIAVFMPIPVAVVSRIWQWSAAGGMYLNDPLTVAVLGALTAYLTWKAAKIGAPSVTGTVGKVARGSAGLAAGGAILAATRNPRAAMNVARGRKTRGAMQASRSRRSFRRNENE